MENLSSLSAFVCAAEQRNFTAAARTLGISPSAVGKAIIRLEERLGVRLLHRSTRTISLTAEGAIFLERCRRILAEFEAAELELSESQMAPRGKLKVSMPIVSMLMMPAINDFMLKYPDIELDLDFTDRMVEVIDEGFDAVVRGGHIADSRLMSRMLGSFRLLIVASPGYLKQKGTPQTPEDLLHHSCLMHRYATSGKLEPWPLFHATGEEIKLDLPTRVIVNTIEPIVQLAEQGIGIGCLPDFAIRNQLDDSRLVPILSEYVRHSGPFRLLWPSSRHISPKLRVFLDFMAKNLFPDASPREQEECVAD